MAKAKSRGERPLTASDAAGELWTISTKLHGLGFLIKRIDDTAEPPTQVACYGIGTILAELAEHIDEVRARLEG